MPACVQKPEGLPQISDVVLDKANKCMHLYELSICQRILKKKDQFPQKYQTAQLFSTMNRNSTLPSQE